MKTQIDQTLLDAVHKIGPRIRELGEVGERERRLPTEAMDLMREAGLFRMWVPRSLGGLEVDPVTHARVVEELSAYDSAAGWMLMVCSSGAWWASRLPEEGVDEIYADGPDVTSAVAFHPPIEAHPVEGGFRLTGRRPFASGSGAAQWLWMTALVMDGDAPKLVDGNPVAMIVFFRAEEAEIHDTWHTLGMRGTDSGDISVTEVFVPSRRTIVLDPAGRIGSRYAGPLYRFPAMGLNAAYMAPVAVAVARSAIDEVIEIARGKTPFNSTSTLRERAGAQGKIGRAEGVLRSARALLYETMDDAWQRTLAGEVLTIEQRTLVFLASVHPIQAAAQAAELAWSTAGTTGIYQRSRLERAFRDAKVLSQHGFANDSRYETVGQVAFGLAPDLGFIAF